MNTETAPQRIRTDAFIPPGGGQSTGQNPYDVQRIIGTQREGLYATVVSPGYTTLLHQQQRRPSVRPCRICGLAGGYR